MKSPIQPQHRPTFVAIFLAFCLVFVTGAGLSGTLGPTPLSQAEADGRYFETAGDTATGDIDSQADIKNTGTASSCTGTGDVCINDADGLEVVNTTASTNAMTIPDDGRYGFASAFPYINRVGNNLAISGTGPQFSATVFDTRGIGVTNDTATVGGTVYINDEIKLGKQTLTIADSGDANPAAATLTPTMSYVSIDCQDANGCDVTMGETDIEDGQFVTIVNTSSNTVNFADTTGVSETQGAFAAGQWDTIEMLYASDRWVEQNRSNN